MANDPNILFHATRSELEPGEVVANAHTTFYPNVVALLESARPHNCPSRSKCLFAADTPEAAYTYLERQSRDDPSGIKIYRVQMDVYHRAPFRLIFELNERLQKAQPTEDLVEEYWSAHHPWVFWEYFGPSFIILDRVDVDRVKAYAFGLRYQLKDCDFSNTL